MSVLTGLELFDKCVDIDKAHRRTPRSNPATYTGIFTTNAGTLLSKHKKLVSRRL